MAKPRYKSDLDEAIHSAAAGLHRARVIDKKTMREYDELCIADTPEFSAQDVANIRKNARVSQPVFARYLNTSLSTVQKWETGAKHPSGMAAKLLQIVRKHGIEMLA
ncbi:putative transcriptional regulator [Trinickia symbiotica]|uniref:Transcriptional regulator n=1 Tax=Trinickia symbiotica TaxID=863227 RepID=A0A2N7WZY5_9BURK|nr:DNA-binding transcriptional regulator [Trinickia symbiotica]PMS34881.1 transcriptional regulator [Trinickia symbiotica]PPK45103.1 putative transcriptional regulator [Trinickia symbiotica]